MTLIAGIINRVPGPLPQPVTDRIERSISRCREDNVDVYETDRSFVAKVDIGAFCEGAETVDKDGVVTLVAGEPLIGDGGRSRNTSEIHRSLLRGDTSTLAQADGVFAAVHYRPATNELLLVTDKLGIRPLYYFVSDNLVVFASALRILEELAEVPKVMDVRAVTEMVGLGYALADRTPYVDIKLLRAGEIVRISENAVRHETYWRWDEVEQTDLSKTEPPATLYDRFVRAVARRNGSDRTTGAYLSGGLDSRCIVGELCSQKVAVRTFNFARPNTQDQIFGREFATAVGADHQELPKQPGDLVPDYSTLMSNAWMPQSSEATRPHLVWSGEGGSVALGHVHMSEEIVAFMRDGKIDEAIDEYLRREFAQVSPRIFKNGCGPRLATIINEGIREEIARLNCRDAARNFYFFLMLNDQHRKLGKHFESIDLHRLEFQLPFFDSSFIEIIASVPIETCLGHKLYLQWLSHFPNPVSSIPWQAYPGHEPCPVAVGDKLDYQWSNEYQNVERTARKTLVLSQARELLNNGHFPGKLLDKRLLRLATLAHRTGLRDYGYLIGPAHTYYSYVKKCGGRYEFTD